MTIILGLFITLACMLGGFTAMGGHVWVIWQPWEYVIICGAALGTFVVANPMKTIKDTGKATLEAFKNGTPTQAENIELLSLLYFMMRELRDKSRAEMEMIIDAPHESEVFKRSPSVTSNDELSTFICDYFRLIIMGNARTHEIESLMDEEIETVRHDKLKAYHALVAVADGLPALGIIAAVLGVVKAMGAIDQSPGNSRAPDRLGTCRHVCRYLLLLRRGWSARHEGQDHPRQEPPMLRHREAISAGIHERRHAASRDRTWPEGDFRLRTAVDRRR